MTLSPLILVGLVTVLPAHSAAGTEVTLLEQQYTRERGTPVVETSTFEAVEGVGLLTVTNSGVSSAIVKLNGVVVLAPRDFRRNVVDLERAVDLQSHNTLQVELRGKPGASLALLLIQEQDLLPIVYYARHDGREIRRILSDGSEESVTAPPYGACGTPAVSSSGSELAITCGTNGWDSQIWVMGTDGSGAYRLLEAAWCQQLDWIDNDTQLAYDDYRDGIHRIAPSGGTAPLWISVSHFASFGKNDIRHPGVRWSADRTRFVANVGNAGAGGNEIFVGDLDYATGTLTAVRRLSPAAGSSWTSVAGGADISADGDTVYYSWHDSSAGLATLTKVGFDGSNPEVILESTTGAIGYVQLSPDGQRVWFTSSCSASSCVIASTNLDGSGYEELATSQPAGGFDLAQP